MQQRLILKLVLVHDVSDHQGVQDLRINIAVSLLLSLVHIRARHPTVRYIGRQAVINVLGREILQVLCKRKGIYGDFVCSSHKQGRETAALEKGVRAGDENAVFLSGVQAVYCLLKGLAHLHLIDKKVVLATRRMAFLNIGLHGPVIHDVLEVGEVVVDMDNVGVGLYSQNAMRQSLHELRFPRPAHAGDDLDIGRVGQLEHLGKIRRTLNEFHCRPP